jgi:pyrimidine-specific ribonucleoside hydrolase
MAAALLNARDGERTDIHQRGEDMKANIFDKAIAGLFLIAVLALCGACVQQTIKPPTTTLTEPAHQPTTTPPRKPLATSQAPTDRPEATPILVPPTLSQKPVIWDDDGSPDGVIALLYLLKNPQVRVEAITVSCGEAHPGVFAQNLTRMLARIERQGIPVAAGRETPLEGTNAFPEPWRISTDEFWGSELPSATDPVQPVTASELIVDIVNQSPEPITVFLTGNHTNLAEALKLDPSIAERIDLVEVMGGALFIPGNIESDWPEIPNRVAEWNIWVDPIAAHEVLTSSLPIRLVPLDSTNQVIWTETDALAWETSGSPEGVLAAEILRWMLRSWYPEGVYAWDVVAAVDMTEPDVCQHIDRFVRIATEPGDTQGQTIVEDSQPPNTSICMTPMAEKLKDHVAEIFRLPD